MLFSTDGIGHSSDGKNTDASSRDYFQKTLEGRRVLSSPLSSSVDNETLVVLTVPVYDKDQNIIGVFGGSIDVAKLTTMLFEDLYSGSGLFTLPLATLSAGRTRMLSVEGGKTAVKHAQRNLRAIHLGNADARVGDVAKTLANVRNDLAKPDIVVLDPPRAGARAKVCRQIAESGARSVVYIACDPASLARDTATLASLGYDLADIRAFDIYPTTHHVETVALFRKATR
mgnify:CR=1 FL=1